MTIMKSLFIAAFLSSFAFALPSPQTPAEQQIQQIQQMQASSTDQTGNTQAALQNQIASLAGHPPANWAPASYQSGYLAQIQALQQQMAATTDPAAQAAIQQQIVATQNQQNRQTAQGWFAGPYWAPASNPGGAGSQQAFLAQIQAMRQQMAATTDAAAQAAIQNQINAVQTQMNNHAAAANAWNPYWNNGASSNYWNGNSWNSNWNNNWNTANQDRNSALTAQIQALQQQMGATTDVNAQAAINQQIAAVQAQMV